MAQRAPERLAQISESDLADAEAAWESDAPSQWKRLLEAVVFAGLAVRSTSRFLWQVELRRFLRFGVAGAQELTAIADSIVRQVLDVALEKAAARAQQVSSRYRLGELSLSEWDREMRAVIKDTQLYSAALAKGGWEQIGSSDIKAVEDKVAQQYGRLAAFRSDVAGGAQPTDGRFLQRAKMYAQASRGTFEAVRQDDEISLGRTEERNVLHPADHCAECVAETARGWSPIGSLTLVGERVCLVNCKCTVEYR